MSRRKARREEHILTDAGPLAALVDRNDPNFGRVLEEMKRLPDVPLLTTWPCLTEAMYLVLLHDRSLAERHRMRVLMQKYSDTPMDFADASLVAVAETLDLRRVLTVDSDFYVYRLADGDALEVIVGPRRR